MRGRRNERGDVDQEQGSAGSEPATMADGAPLRPDSFSAEELAELERRERLGGWLVLFFAGAAIATAALAFYLFSDDIEQNDSFVRIDRDEPEKLDDEPFSWGQKQPDAEQVPGEVAAKADDRVQTGPRNSVGPAQEAATSPQVFDFPGPPEPAAGPSFAGPPSGSVDRETARALRSGKAQLWREDGQRGYVLVSEAVRYGTRECRQVSYTRFDQGTQLSSPSAQWCRLGKSNKWRPDPRGPE